MCDHCGCRSLTPVAALMQEHDRLRELSDSLRRHLAAAEEAAARADWLALLAVLGPHVAKEEGFLFPLLSRDPGLAAHVGVLQDEHAGLYDAVDDLDDTSAADVVAWAAGTRAVLHDLDRHMVKEDFGLFPAALATLDGADWDAMDQWEALHTARP